MKSILVIFLLATANVIVASPKTILCFGDSITFGWEVSRPWPSRLQDKLPSDRVINAGVSGELTFEGRRRLPGLLSRHNPTHVLILHGANNINLYQSNSRAVEDLKAMARMSWQVGAIPIIGTVTPFTNRRSNRQPRAEQLNQLIRWERSSEAYPVADVGLAFANGSSLMQSDGIHPNDRGLAVIADSFYQLLQIVDSQGVSPIWDSRLQTWLFPQDNGRFWSYDYFIVSPDAAPDWSRSSEFGSLFTGSGNGYIWSEKLGWITTGASNGESYIYSANLIGWLDTRSDGSLYSFDFGRMESTEIQNRFNTTLWGPSWSGEFGGWIASDRFGWTWADRTTPMTWFFSEKEGWLGLPPGSNGPFWSANRGDWIPTGP